ncbi:MAG: hypothetical protein PW734_01690 [Verrucomicrobium sp.]|nr:hypothetical protein [Verrucomicrobium sp.]
MASLLHTPQGTKLYVKAASGDERLVTDIQNHTGESLKHLGWGPVASITELRPGAPDGAKTIVKGVHADFYPQVYHSSQWSFSSIRSSESAAEIAGTVSRVGFERPKIKTQSAFSAWMDRTFGVRE